MSYYIGLMSGTSVDGIDAVVVEMRTGGTLAVKETHHHPIPVPLRDEIEALLQPGPNEIDRMGELDVQLGELFAQAAVAVLAKTGLAAGEVRAIGSHGQTVRHRPKSTHPFTLQLGNPAVIAERTGIMTVADFRRRDMAAGGEGAPLVPTLHDWLFRSPKYNRAIMPMLRFCQRARTEQPGVLTPARATPSSISGPRSAEVNAATKRDGGRPPER